MVVMWVDVEVVLVVLAVLLVGVSVEEIGVAVAQVEDIISSARDWRLEEQEFWMHDFAFDENELQVHPPFVKACQSMSYPSLKILEEPFYI